MLVTVAGTQPSNPTRHLAHCAPANWASTAASYCCTQANGENNNDGSNDNFSWNCGVEGHTGDEGVLTMRYKQMRNYLTALIMSIGTPMIVMGELGQALLL